MIKKILKTINDNKLFSKGDRIGVAVSGGADSVALVLLLNELKTELGVSLFVIHVNHNIRGKESDADAEFVANLSKKLALDYVILNVDAVKFSKINKFTLEQGARILRYDAIKKVMEEKGLNKLALAHHIGDQAETVLMHMFRGCGANGLVGMKFVSGVMVRPLLEVSKVELEDYLKAKNQEWREDSTNYDTKYARNYLRKEILPKVEEVYPGAMCHIAQLSQRIKRDEEFLDSLIPDSLFGAMCGGVVLKNEVSGLHDRLKERAIKKALDKLGASVDVFEVHIDSLVKLIGAAVGKKLNLPNEIVAIRDYNGIIFIKDIDCKFNSRKFRADDEFDYLLGKVCIKNQKDIQLGKDYLIADTAKIPENAVWRKIKSGDKFTKFGGGTKNIADYLTDKKVSSFIRQRLVVLANGDEVLVIPGIEISDKIKVDDKTTSIVKICFTKN